MAQAQEYVRNFHEETEHGILASNKVWGDFTDSVIEGSKAWKGTASEIVSAISDINNAVTNAAKNSHLRMLLGQSSPAVSAYQSVADQYGLDVDYVRRNASTTYVQRILQMAAQADADVVATNMDAMALAIGADNLLGMFGAPNLESGTTATLDIPTA